MLANSRRRVVTSSSSHKWQCVRQRNLHQTKVKVIWCRVFCRRSRPSLLLPLARSRLIVRMLAANGVDQRNRQSVNKWRKNWISNSPSRLLAFIVYPIVLSCPLKRHIKQAVDRSWYARVKLICVAMSHTTMSKLCLSSGSNRQKVH